MVELQVPSDLFPGFYNTYLDPGEQEMYEDDWEGYKQSVCKNVISIVNKFVEVVDWRLFQPKEYNYRNDELYITIDRSLEDFLIEYLRDKKEVYCDVMEWGFDNYRDVRLIEAFMESILYCKIFYDESIECEELDNLEEYLIQQ